MCAQTSPRGKAQTPSLRDRSFVGNLSRLQEELQPDLLWHKATNEETIYIRILQNKIDIIFLKNERKRKTIHKNQYMSVTFLRLKRYDSSTIFALYAVVKIMSILYRKKIFFGGNSTMYDDMMIQELNEDQLEQVVGGKKGASASVSNTITLANLNANSNTNTNVATSASTSAATATAIAFTV
jgi:hypothetical protein